LQNQVRRISKLTKLNSIILLSPPSKGGREENIQTLKDEIEYLKKMVDRFLDK
jgi:hypothetical protein